MQKRIVIAGCRDYTNYIQAKQYIERAISNIKNEFELIFVSGGADGADALGERYAKEIGYKLEVYPAQWKRYGKKAGPLRNKQMAEISDYVICFWDGQSRGTKSMIDEAKSLNRPIKVYFV